MKEKVVYLLVKEVNGKYAESFTKVYTSKSFACAVRDSLNGVVLDSELIDTWWRVVQLDVDQFKTIKDLKCNN